MKKQRRALICEYCGEYRVYHSETRIMRFCDRTCFNRAHADPILGPARRAYFDQVRAARSRDILFLFSFDEWWSFWKKSGHWDKRGLKRGQYVMARFGDVGPYSADNVEIVKTEHNISTRKHKTRGVTVNTAKLTEQQVIAIRALENSGLSQSEIGRRFGVDHTQIKRIWSRVTW